MTKLNSLLASGALLLNLSCLAVRADECKIDCVEPTAACSESARVIETLKVMTSALTKGDITTYEEYLDEGCTTFDERTKKLVAGREAVIADLKQKFVRYSPTGETPLISYTIDHPYAKVTGDTAVVTFVAVRETGGAHPSKEQANVTDVFVKRGDKWKKLHYRALWKKVS